MVKKFFSHYATRPQQQPQMPDIKQIKRSVCNHIRHFSLLSYLPSAGNPSTQPPIRRLALPLIRSIIQPNGHPSPPSIACKVAVDVIADYAKGFHKSFLLKHQKLYPTWQQPQFFFNIFRLQFLKPCVYVPSLIHLKRICTNR